MKPISLKDVNGNETFKYLAYSSVNGKTPINNEITININGISLYDILVNPTKNNIHRSLGINETSALKNDNLTNQLNYTLESIKKEE